MAGAVRQPIDIQALEGYISKNVPQIKVPIELKQFGFGQSNPTYQIKDSTGAKYVMRKKPPGKLLSKTAHQVEREYKIIHALEHTDVPVPKAYCLCEDASVIGTAFYIMEFLDGRIIEDASMPDVTPAERTEMWHDAVRTLAKFHRIVPRDVGLESYGKPSGFYDRQIKTFSTISKLQGETRDIETKEPVGPIAHFDEMIDFFKNKQNQPKDRGTLVHGDYKIDNVVFHKTEPRVIGVLDWEMSTVGHPLSDLVNLLNPYTMRELPGKTDLHKFKDGRTPGLPTQDQIVSWYAEVAGWNPSPDVPFGKAFGLFKATFIFQGIAARYAVRQASSAQAKEMGAQMHPVGKFTWENIQKAKKSLKVGAKL